MTRLVLDAGALIALDRNERPMWERLALARRHLTPLVTHGGVVGQVWRRPARQARLAQALQAIRIWPLDAELGKVAGQLLAATGTADAIDAALVALSQPGDRLYTSDPDDLHALAVAHGLTCSASLYPRRFRAWCPALA